MKPFSRIYFTILYWFNVTKSWVAPQGHWPSERLPVMSLSVCDSCCVLAPQSWRPRSYLPRSLFFTTSQLSMESILTLIFFSDIDCKQPTVILRVQSPSISHKHNPLSPQPFMCLLPRADGSVPLNVNSHITWCLNKFSSVWMCTVKIICVQSTRYFFPQVHDIVFKQTVPSESRTQVCRTFPL